MTRKKEEKEKMSKDSKKSEDKPISSEVNTESKVVDANIDKEEGREQEIKLLEGEEQKVLEFQYAARAYVSNYEEAYSLLRDWNIDTENNSWPKKKEDSQFDKFKKNTVKD